MRAGQSSINVGTIDLKRNTTKIRKTNGERHTSECKVKSDLKVVKSEGKISVLAVRKTV